MILSRLKLETRELHLRVERDLGIMRSDLSLADYGALLSRLYAFHAGWEPLVGRLLADEPFFGPRRKLALLARDLDALDLPRPRMSAWPIDPALRTQADALGSLYVLEGSTLGGQFIAKHVEGALHLPRGSGSAYFRSYGKQVAERWREFQERVVSASSPEADNAMVRAAGATFQHLHDWLCPALTGVNRVRRYG